MLAELVTLTYNIICTYRLTLEKHGHWYSLCYSEHWLMPLVTFIVFTGTKWILFCCSYFYYERINISTLHLFVHYCDIVCNCRSAYLYKVCYAIHLDHMVTMKVCLLYWHIWQTNLTYIVHVIIIIIHIGTGVLIYSKCKWPVALRLWNPNIINLIVIIFFIITLKSTNFVLVNSGWLYQ